MGTFFLGGGPNNDEDYILLGPILRLRNHPIHVSREREREYTISGVCVYT